MEETEKYSCISTNENIDLSLLWFAFCCTTKIDKIFFEWEVSWIEVT